MTFEEYLNNLQELAKKRPETLKYLVVYSVDDEGNSFERVFNEPGIGTYNDILSHFDYEDSDFDSESENAVCIN